MQSRVLAILIAVVLALVATVALVVYVNGADRRAIAGQDPVTVWVAVKPITAGTSGVNAKNSKLISQVVVPKRSAVDGAVVSLNQIQNKRAEVDIVPGEQLLLSRWVNPEEVTGRRLLPIPEDHQALSIGVDVTRQVAGFVTPGDHVSMVVSMKRPGPGGDRDRSQFLLQNVQVLAVGATALSNASSQGGGGRVNQKGSQSLTAVTLSIPEGDVEEVVYAAEHGSIYLTLMPAEAEEAPVASGGVTATNVIPENR